MTGKFSLLAYDDRESVFPLEDHESTLEGTDSLEDEDVFHQEYTPLEETIYGWAISNFVRDVFWLSEGSTVPMERVARIISSMLLVILTICLQVFLLLAVSRLLSAPAVLEIRQTYGQYESLMYPNHTRPTENGFPRGVPGYRVEERFALMSTPRAKKVCQIPLSHPWYLCSVLFVWTLTCQVELRLIFETAVRLLWLTPLVRTPREMLISQDHNLQVEGLTAVMKLVIAVLLFLPRTLAVLGLLYLGCRWLTATLGLGDVLLNGLALEFMVLLKELLYNVCMSQRNRVDTQRLLIRPLRRKNTVSLCTFFEGFFWGFLSIVWAVVYIYKVQIVLPEYRWDVRDLCLKHLPQGPLF
mmetsp:Transcript_51806/g.150475  ORF Transcript_51806/g.150475 Transcript_51806/m.150475 type:complete len:356 (+) Transcript_51806:52-1119(+)